jgi:hypothetical protein
LARTSGPNPTRCSLASWPHRAWAVTDTASRSERAGMRCEDRTPVKEHVLRSEKLAGREGTLREQHRGHARPRQVTCRRAIPLPCAAFVPAPSLACPPFPPRRSMVRRGSRVRVRQRAPAKIEALGSRPPSAAFTTSVGRAFSASVLGQPLEAILREGDGACVAGAHSRSPFPVVEARALEPPRGMLEDELHAGFSPFGEKPY